MPLKWSQGFNRNMANRRNRVVELMDHYGTFDPDVNCLENIKEIKWNASAHGSSIGMPLEQPNNRNQIAGREEVDCLQS
jgi:hypothetical protein